jgi:hypothetical protein
MTPARSLAPWLPADTLSGTRAVIERALKDIGLLETPLGSNRSGRIDEYNRAAGVAEGSYWCASACGAWWRECGFEVPRGYASCDAWLTWAKVTQRWRRMPELGAAVLYGVPGDARHIGLIVRLTPAVLSVEGNTTVEGSAFERNGTAVAMKLVTDRDPVLGYVSLYPALPEGKLA